MKILNVREHPDADKLYVLEIDTGTGRRQLVAGLREYYRKEELADKKCAFVANLKPAKIRGIESQGMILAADDGKTVSILSAEKSEAGAPIFAEGVPRKPASQVSFEDFQKLGIVVGKDGCATYKGKRLRTDKEELRAERKVDEGTRVR